MLNERQLKMLYHVLYEIDMYLRTILKMIALSQDTNNDQNINNMVVESNLLHLRILVDFFNNKEFSETINNIKENDNIIVKNIIDTQSIEITSDKKYKGITGIKWIGKTIQHISYARLDDDMFEIRNDICNEYYPMLISRIETFIDIIEPIIPGGYEIQITQLKAIRALLKETKGYQTPESERLIMSNGHICPGVQIEQTGPTGQSFQSGPTGSGPIQPSFIVGPTAATVVPTADKTKYSF